VCNQLSFSKKKITFARGLKLAILEEVILHGNYFWRILVTYEVADKFSEANKLIKTQYFDDAKIFCNSTNIEYRGGELKH